MPAYYALILRSLTVLEGLALSADPNYKLLARAYPYMARRLLTDPAPELRGSFEELVLQVRGGGRVCALYIGWLTGKGRGAGGALRMAVVCVFLGGRGREARPRTTLCLSHTPSQSHSSLSLNHRTPSPQKKTTNKTTTGRPLPLEPPREPPQGGLQVAGLRPLAARPLGTVAARPKRALGARDCRSGAGAHP